MINIRDYRIKTDRVNKENDVPIISSIMCTLAILVIMLIVLVISLLVTIQDLSDSSNDMQNEIRNLQQSLATIEEDYGEMEGYTSELHSKIEALYKEIEALENTVVNVELTSHANTYSAKPAVVYSRVVDFDPQNDFSVENTTGASREHLSELINWIIDKRGLSPNNEMLDTIDALITVESEYGISATVILSIITWESGFCEGWPSEFENANNAMGIMGDGGARQFDSVSDCVLYAGKLLRNSYVDKGNNTINEIGPIYCTGDSEWAAKISRTTEDYNEKLAEIMN